jgi:hypothetical protein
MNPDLKNKVRDALKVADARRASAMAEYRRLYEKFQKLGPPRVRDWRPRPTTDPFETGFSEMEDGKRKSGRPGIWKGSAGYWLVKTVEEIQEANGRCSLAQAIRKAVKTDSVLKNYKPLRRISDRALQARYQQAAEYWALARRGVLRKELDKAREAAEIAIERAGSLRQLLKDFL